MEKQTAVEFIKHQIEENSDTSFLNIDWHLFDKIIEQAKEMEKEQIIEAWMAKDNPLQRIAAEQYYKETYEQTPPKP